ncbi:MAG: hypothetical protein IBX55_15975 [Methyloprofundus sp.]|nr:hypothetical protein [Methyloprofundus sp.]
MTPAIGKYEIKAGTDQGKFLFVIDVVEFDDPECEDDINEKHIVCITPFTGNNLQTIPEVHFNALANSSDLTRVGELEGFALEAFKQREALKKAELERYGL